MFSTVSVNIGGSVFSPDRFDVISGLSVIFLFADSSKIGLALNPIKMHCAECSTPIAEIMGGSLIIRSKHHGEKHTTSIAISELNKITQLQ